MMWFALTAVLLAYLAGRAAATRWCARILRDVCHFDAANLIDPPKESNRG